MDNKSTLDNNYIQLSRLISKLQQKQEKDKNNK